MRSILLLLSGLCIALSSCSLTLPVQGQFADGSQTFSGTATGRIDGGGTMTLVSSEGLNVVGNFVYVNGRQGEGTFSASDGRAGAFSFVSTGMSGTGTGYLGKDKVIFSFGKKAGSANLSGTIKKKAIDPSINDF